MIVILYSWFKDWGLVGYTLWEVPFSLVGSLALLKVFGLNLSISAAAGIIVVIGVSFLTGIMLISAFSTGIGSETAKPFAVSILGGLVTSLLLTLLFLPALLSQKRRP